MRKKSFVIAATLVLSCAVAAGAQQRKDLAIYFVDVEGGQSTLFVSPSGQSLLVDTGFPGARDADRIASVAKEAGISQIDYLVITHYHGDHVGGVTELVKRILIKTFIDHGPSMEETLNVPQNYKNYLAASSQGQHITAKAGDKLPVKGIDVQVVSAAAQQITKPLHGAGAANPLCADFQPMDEKQQPLLAGENAQSVAMIISLGKFRMADFGDLTWNYEHNLACPKNLLGTIDFYLTTQHGQEISGPPALVYALHPRAAVMNNGAKKGGDPETFRRLHKSPGLEDLWQLHYAEGATDLNSPEQFIANPDVSTANDIQVIARPDGSFTITNTRNGYHKDYAPHN